MIEPQNSKQHLHGSIIDPMLLGIGSVFVLVLIFWLAHGDPNARTWSLSTTLVLANIVNHPHFAVSYQIFYSNYWEKLTSSDTSRSLRLRYLIVGLVVPSIIILVLALGVIAEEAKVIGLVVNSMFFLVGWHYIKQGYGIAMVDAALKKRFFSQSEKNGLLVNGYLVWILSWVWANVDQAGAAKRYFDIPYYIIPFPVALLDILQLCVILTSINLARLIWLRMREGKAVAWVGFASYLVSLYVWLLVRDPILLVWYPLFHSIQYLAVVSRFQINRYSASRYGGLRLLLSAAISVLLGYYFFWVIPEWLDQNINYDRDVFGSTLFIVIFWVFINIHHYFIDTVMWRKENADVKKYIFFPSAR